MLTTAYEEKDDEIRPQLLLREHVREMWIGHGGSFDSEQFKRIIQYEIDKQMSLMKIVSLNIVFTLATFMISVSILAIGFFLLNIPYIVFGFLIFSVSTIHTLTGIVNERKRRS